MGPALPCTIVPSDFNQTVGGHCPISVACTAFAVAETADQVLGARVEVPLPLGLANMNDQS